MPSFTNKTTFQATSHEIKPVHMTRQIKLQCCTLTVHILNHVFELNHALSALSIEARNLEENLTKHKYKTKTTKALEVHLIGPFQTRPTPISSSNHSKDGSIGDFVACFSSFTSLSQ